MAYDQTYPQSSDAVSASKIRENFLAIFEGRVDHEKVKLAKQGGDPSAATDEVQLYCKDDTTAELFIRPEEGTVIQCSEDGRLGSDSTAIAFDTLSHDKGTSVYDENNLVSAWAYFAKTTSNGAMSKTGGSAATGTVLTAERTGTGQYTVTFGTAMSSANYGAIGTVINDGSGNPHNLVVHTLGTSTFLVEIKNHNATAVDRAFSIMVLGGR